MNDRIITVVIVVAIFAGGGYLVGGIIGSAIGAILGAIAGIILDRSGVRSLVAMVVAAAAVIGGAVGKGIVDSLCLPGTCAALSWFSAVVLAIGALVGVGLVVALASRSFDEYHEASARTKSRPRDDGQ